MMNVPLPSDETDRLAELVWFQILDTAPEKGFDRITRIAAQIAQTPIALVSLVDKDRQWFKSSCGLFVSETGRDEAFCSYTILERSPVIIEDALEDDRFKNNSLVTGEPHIRAYAGIPLVTENDFALGSLCVIDTRPRKFSDEQITVLGELAETVMDLMRYRLLQTDVRQTTSMFSSQISHEIRTPLNAIIGFSEALMSGSGKVSRERNKEYLEIISNSGRELEQTLGKMLDGRTADRAPTSGQTTGDQ